MTEDFDDAHIDLWNQGALDGCGNWTARSTNPHYLAGYAHGQRERKVRPVMPQQPEGYYHLPIGSFDE